MAITCTKNKYLPYQQTSCENIEFMNYVGILLSHVHKLPKIWMGAPCSSWRAGIHEVGLGQ